MDLRSNNNFEEKSLKNPTLLLIKRAAHRGPAAAPSQRGLQAAQKKGTPAPQKRRRYHQVEWSWPRFIHPCTPMYSMSSSGVVLAQICTPMCRHHPQVARPFQSTKAGNTPFIFALVSHYQERLYVILSLRAVERRQC